MSKRRSTTTQQRCWLPLSPSHVSKRRGRGGSGDLSYLEGSAVTAKLNDVFGPDGWSTQVQDLRTWDPVEIGGKLRWQAVCTLSLEVNFPENAQTKTASDTGYGSGIGWDGLELAVKEARTDALKRCAKDLGPYFGLGLYDKGNPLHNGGIDSWGRVPSGHHPEWDSCRPWFMGTLSSMDYSYEDVKTWLIAKTGKKPSSGGRDALNGLIEQLKKPEVRAQIQTDATATQATNTEEDA